MTCEETKYVCPEDLRSAADPVYAESYLSGKQILITGAAGFLGAHLATLLTSWRARVRCYDLQPLASSSVENVIGDVRNGDQLTEAASGCHIVFHLAAEVGVEATLTRGEAVRDVNTGGTRNALEAAKRAGAKRLVFASSSEVYGEGLDEPLSEERGEKPLSIYGLSKLAAEEAVRSFHSEGTGLETTIVRLFNVYGPGQREDFVVARFLKRAKQGLPPEIYGSGDQIRCFTYVDDAVAGLCLAASHPAARGLTFNIGNPVPTRIADLAASLGAKFGLGAPLYRAFGDGIRPASREIHSRIPSIGRAQRHLGFQPTVPLEEGLIRCIGADEH